MKVTNLMLMTLDGAIASNPHENTQDRLRLGMTSPEDQALLHKELGASDAVILGAETLRTEGSVPEIKNALGYFPTWCIYTRRGLDGAIPFWKQKAIRRIFVSEQKLPTWDGAEPFAYGKGAPGRTLLEELKRRGMKKVLLLGGSKVNQIFYGEGLVNELKLTIAPQLLGNSKGPHLVSGPLKDSVSLKLLSCESQRSFVFLHYVVL